MRERSWRETNLLRGLYLSFVNGFEERMVERFSGRYPFGRVKGQHFVKKIQWNIWYHAAAGGRERASIKKIIYTKS